MANISVEYIRVLSAPGVDVTLCVSPCTPSGIVVKWRNDGDTEATFVPKVIVTNIDTGVQIELAAPSPLVRIPAHYTSPPMAIYSPTLGIGTYDFCPVENPYNACVRINVALPIEPRKPSGLLLLGLVAIGAMLFLKK